MKKFIFEDIPKYNNAVFKSKPGAPPKLHFLDKDGDIVETIDLETLTRAECNEELVEHGFTLKEAGDKKESDERQNVEL